MKDKLFKIGYGSFFTVICIVSIICMIIAISSGCGNRTVFDTRYTFNYAVVSLFDGTTVEGEVKSWKDYDDSDMVQVIFSDGTVYYTHGSNVILIYKK